jgi:hypothetical protein
MHVLPSTADDARHTACANEELAFKTCQAVQQPYSTAQHSTAQHTTQQGVLYEADMAERVAAVLLVPAGWSFRCCAKSMTLPASRAASLPSAAAAVQMTVTALTAQTVAVTAPSSACALPRWRLL